jgi:hypothetical protein
VKTLFTILSLLLLAHITRAQEQPVANFRDSAFSLVKTYEGDIADAAMDNLGNLYIISSTGQIKKFNVSGDSLAVYNQVKNFGKLYSIDVTNPLKILLFYKDFSTVVILDRFLANMSSVNLRKVNILQPGAIGLSYDNNIWVFDEYDNRLKKIDEGGNKMMESADLRTFFSEGLSPQKIINDNGLVYLADTTNGIFIFDNYGSFKKKVPLKNWQSIAVNSNNLVSTRNEVISVYNTSTMMEARKKYPFFQPYYHSFTSSNKLISFSPTQLHIYQYRF